MQFVPQKTKHFALIQGCSCMFLNTVICFLFHKISLQSEAGQYECSVSALRWVCNKKVSFHYQFRSWEEHMAEPACIDYMPAGPLLDITVTDGKLEEVHLPHWIGEWTYSIITIV